jgi:hypothetical protein
MGVAPKQSGFRPKSAVEMRQVERDTFRRARLALIVYGLKLFDHGGQPTLGSA